MSLLISIDRALAESSEKPRKKIIEPNSKAKKA
eukprot:CAMPEP_0115013794 /NCGR_PEP_ID=MMETSP0216-20121206/25646_1 /TAXON_ID=223996 /ORGANISM="Protocruzia adherens, Strain Boccale" /LENGTH=32 /DNA_ID= /DNA_START= /DNA_END= /DNA_ORIENTATION=